MTQKSEQLKTETRKKRRKIIVNGAKAEEENVSNHIRPLISNIWEDYTVSVADI